MPCFAVPVEGRYNRVPEARENARSNEERAMGDTISGGQSSETAHSERLDSWKGIAAHFDRDVSTVQRWEKREGMPVHRHLHDRAGSIYAFTAELDEWARSRNVRIAQPNPNDIRPAIPFAVPP